MKDVREVRKEMYRLEEEANGLEALIAEASLGSKEKRAAKAAYKKLVLRIDELELEIHNLTYR